MHLSPSIEYETVEPANQDELDTAGGSLALLNRTNICQWCVDLSRANHCYRSYNPETTCVFVTYRFALKYFLCFGRALIVSLVRLVQSQVKILIRHFDHTCKVRTVPINFNDFEGLETMNGAIALLDHLSHPLVPPCDIGEGGVSIIGLTFTTRRGTGDAHQHGLILMETKEGTALRKCN